MQILKDIKMGRLVLAVAVTLLVADTIPHPNLGAGALSSALSRLQDRWDERSAMAIAEFEP